GCVAGMPIVIPMAPPPPQGRELFFSRYGQEHKFEIGEPVQMVFSGLDPDNTDIVTKADFEDNTMTMKIVPKGFNEEINIEKKCQIVNVGLGPLPKITVSPTLAREQIIVTPRLNDDCIMTGYEIRAGTIESGCLQGRYNLKRLRNCHKIIILPPPDKSENEQGSRHGDKHKIFKRQVFENFMP
ncbi:MAG: hypothetical protein WCT77_13285, partial [Bacteroidota bacterium]